MKQKRVDLSNVTIQDDFFGKILNTIRCVTVPDILTKFEHDRGGAIDNFDKVRDGEQGEHAGPPWYDGLTYETMTGISDLFSEEDDHVIQLWMDNYICRIAAAAARDENGYINTYTQTLQPDHRFGFNGGNQRWLHELYNAGCLVEAGVHQYTATHKTLLLDTAVKFACYICKLFGPAPKKSIVPAHSLPEEAFVELYRLFRDDQYIRERYPEAENGKCFLEMAEYWIEERGHHCGLPDWENWSEDECEEYLKDCRYGDQRPTWGAYAQDHKPVLEQDTIEGHAVRAVLLFTGLAACAYENDREDYVKTAERIWKNMTTRRLHATGGVGAIANDEKFGGDYYLPHDAYLETCAAIGSVFFSYNLYLLTGEAKYMHVIENTLTNAILAGVSLSGDKYSYVNPLISDGSLHRWNWHGCPCCPPMDLKLYGRLPQYIYSTTENSITANLFIGSEANLEMNGYTVRICQESRWPWYSASRFVFETGTMVETTFRVRLPEWARDCRFTFNAESLDLPVVNGYAILTRKFEKGDVLAFSSEMPVLVGFANPKVDACSGQVLLKRGPILYCVEQTDNPDGTEIRIDRSAEIHTLWDPNSLGGVMMLEGKMTDGKPFRAVPFFRWDNREAGSMRVWLFSDMKPLENVDWEDKLYHFEKL